MLKEKIEKDFQDALKENNKPKISSLRMLKAAIVNREKEKRYNLGKGKTEASGKEIKEESRLTDEEIVKIIFSEIKKRREAITLFRKGKREDLAEKEEAGARVLEAYLPEQISEEEINRLAREAIGKAGAKGIKDMGRVMKELMPKLNNRADGSLVSRVVRGLLQNIENDGD